MKKLFYIFILISITFTSCDSNDDNFEDLKNENQELREALAANSKIEKVEFSATEMILTYSNGLEVKTGIPDVLNGDDGITPHIGDNGNWWIGDTDTGVIAQGQNGSDGVDGIDGDSPFIGENGNWWIGETDLEISAMGPSGANGLDGTGISKLEYDPTTQTLTISLTNGETSSFVIVDKYGEMLALLISDLKGEFMISNIWLGDVPVAHMEYNDQNLLTKIVYSEGTGFKINKLMEVEKSYTTDGLLSGVSYRMFADEPDDRTRSVGGDFYFNTNKGEMFIEETENGFYKVYQNTLGNNYSLKYGFEVSMDDDLISLGDDTYLFINGENESIECEGLTLYVSSGYECIISNEELSVAACRRKIEDNVFNLYSSSVSGEYKLNGTSSTYYIYELDQVLTSYDVGDVIEEESLDITCNADGKIKTIVTDKYDDGTPERYIENTYNTDGQLTKTEYMETRAEVLTKIKMVMADVPNDYLVYEYNESSLLQSIVSHYYYSDGEEEVETVGEVKYDTEGNLTEVLRYMEADTEERSIIDPVTGMPQMMNYEVTEAGMYPIVKIEYNYEMKNFFGHTLGQLIPELYGFNLNNAPYRISLGNSMTGGSLEYHNFNEGGYPQSVGFVGTFFEEMESFSGELKIDYIKKQ